MCGLLAVSHSLALHPCVGSSSTRWENGGGIIINTSTHTNSVYTFMLATPATGILSLPVKNTANRKSDNYDRLEVYMHLSYAMANTIVHVCTCTHNQQCMSCKGVCKGSEYPVVHFVAKILIL